MYHHTALRWLGVAALVGALGTTNDARTAERSLERLEVFPAEVNLTTSRDRQSIVVLGSYSDGTTRDVSEASEWKLAAPELVRREGRTLYPAKDGETILTIGFEGQSATVPVRIARVGETPPVSFKLDVMPVFSKAGCNTGDCHGAARGKDLFNLSLFGYDPDGDYHRLTREFPGRRIHVAHPDASLVLEKAAGRVPHTGGQRFEAEGELYATLRAWVEAGAPRDAKEVARPVDLELAPGSMVLESGDRQALVAVARYSDGTTRDVTRLAYFLSNNPTSATVTPEGTIETRERGEAFVMARYEGFTVGSHLIVIPKNLEFSFPELPEDHYVDRLVNDKLRKLRIAPSELCSDEDFLRRAFLDITGMLPSVEDCERFAQSESPKKREELVDELLGRKEFVELWVLKWAELLQVRSSNRVSYKAMLLYYNWIQERLAKNLPMDQMVRELLTASGGTFSSPATNYYQNETDTLKVSENVAQVFLGMRIQCAQCHNHPFDRWTQDDYYGFAAFFSQVGRKRAEDPRETIVFNRGGGEVKHPVGGRVMAPKFLGGTVPDVKGRDRRQALAEWLASSENPFFARNLANIVWAHFFGRGIIDEVDDVRVSNPPSNEALLAELGRKFSEYRFDFKKLVRDICTSRTYQLSTRTNASNAGDTRNFSHASLRRIRAEVLLDAIAQVTETDNKFRGLPRGARAVQIADGSTSNYFLEAFGRAKRETVCSCEVQMEPNLSQALHLLNGSTVNANIQRGQVVRRMIREGKKSDREIIENLYLRSLARRPEEAELAPLLQEVEAAGKEREQALMDVFWALLNSREFLFNH